MRRTHYCGTGITRCAYRTSRCSTNSYTTSSICRKSSRQNGQRPRTQETHQGHPCREQSSSLPSFSRWAVIWPLRSNRPCRRRWRSRQRDRRWPLWFFCRIFSITSSAASVKELSSWHCCFSSMFHREGPAG
jgi:hypothetical protein